MANIDKKCLDWYTM